MCQVTSNLDPCWVNFGLSRLQEFEVRPNKRRTIFAEHDVKMKPSAAAWESIPTPQRLLRREAFVKAMEASFDASAARQAWKEDQKAVSPCSQKFK